MISRSTCSAISCASSSESSPGSFRWSESSVCPSSETTLRLWISRTRGTRQRRRVRALAQRRLALPRLDVDDDVDPGQRALERLLDPVGRRVPLADGGAG